ncbi:MAG: RNA polymerase sigma factor [Candidatus Methylomirabilota bacterium]
MVTLQSVNAATPSGKIRAQLPLVQSGQGTIPHRPRVRPKTSAGSVADLAVTVAQVKDVRPALWAPESELVQRLRSGDQSALETLMERYASRVYRLAFGITRNASDAEEVVQDVFLTLFRKVHTFDGRSALGTWIYRISMNTALMKRRRQRTDRQVPLESQLPTFRPDGRREGDPAYLRADWSQTPESELLSQETREILHRGIDSLPALYRAVLVLRDIEGLSNQEVAKVVGASVPAVKSRLHRARLMVRERLTDHLGPQGKARRRRIEHPSGSTR